MFLYLRKCTRKTRRDRIINTQIRGTPVTKVVERRELRWFGHLIRMDSLSRYEKQRVGGCGEEEGQG